jgi:hypothetical protein
VSDMHKLVPVLVSSKPLIRINGLMLIFSYSVEPVVVKPLTCYLIMTVYGGGGWGGGGGCWNSLLISNLSVKN